MTLHDLCETASGKGIYPPILEPTWIHVYELCGEYVESEADFVASINPVLPSGIVKEMGSRKVRYLCAHPSRRGHINVFL